MIAYWLVATTLVMVKIQRPRKASHYLIHSCPLSASQTWQLSCDYVVYNPPPAANPELAK